MTAYISHKANSLALNPEVVTYWDLVMTSPNTRSDQAKSERGPSGATPPGARRKNKQ